MGLPIHKFVAANNANDTFSNYLSNGDYQEKPSVSTYSNAMDVGAPSNFERLEHIYNHSVTDMQKDISSFTANDEMTLEEITHCMSTNNYLLDPHGAVGILALKTALKENEYGLFLETAHPQKFSEIIQKVLPNYKSETVDLTGCNKDAMDNNYADFLKKITN